MVGIEAGAVFQHGLGHVENEAPIFPVDTQQMPGNGEQLVTDPTQPTTAQHRIGDRAVCQVDHEILEGPQPLSLEVDDAVAGQGKRTRVARPSCLVLTTTPLQFLLGQRLSLNDHRVLRFGHAALVGEVGVTPIGRFIGVCYRIMAR